MCVAGFIQLCRSVTGHAIPTKLEPGNANEAHALYTSVAFASQELGWAPRFSLEEALTAAWAWTVEGRPRLLRVDAEAEAAARAAAASHEALFKMELLPATSGHLPLAGVGYPNAPTSFFRHDPPPTSE